ncbi:hypothetical protein GWN26_04080, partial [Candidatus Saccharibacteria bacterium]|nr:hypothetical protein [Calditrichia bacterium]NIV71704.1 hypothetical protein [Calditrichia bacterium]NIV98359.1 hypothetical protein [Candidatus Saccharibacteria bacterium]NIW78643.1 hypothetical protein [Calditrichia bacterium]
TYIAFTLAPRDPEQRKELLKHPHILDLKRLQLKLKRRLRHAKQQT